MKKILLFISKLFGIKSTTIETKELENNNHLETIYSQKPVMTDSEYNFYLKIKELETNYKIVPQLSLSSIIKKQNNAAYYTDLFRIIDFAIFSKDYKELLLLIELNDQTHKTKKRIARDLKVKNICKKCGIELMTFYTQYPNNKDYVIERILKTLQKQDDNDDIEII